MSVVCCVYGLIVMDCLPLHFYGFEIKLSYMTRKTVYSKMVSNIGIFTNINMAKNAL